MKKTFRTLIAIAALSVVTGAQAAQELTRQDAKSAMKIGVVTANGAYTLDQLKSALEMKASEAGATGYRITGVTGNNLLNGNATLYR